MAGQRKTVGGVELDLGRYELRRFGRRVKLERKPMELLIFLVSRARQLVTRDEIVKKLWRSDLFIDSERNLNNIVRKIRTALGDVADQAAFCGDGDREGLPVHWASAGDWGSVPPRRPG